MNTKRFIYPVYMNGRFSNYKGEKTEAVFWRSLVMFFQSWFKRRSQKITIHDWVMSDINTCADNMIQWIGHASFLIRYQGITLITDPVFGDLSFLFPRILPAAYAFEQVPLVDVILISHNHRDHLDVGSIKALYARNPKLELLVPFGDKAWFIKQGYHKVREFMWWEEVSIKGITCTFLPTFHWSQRGLFDRNKSLWGSWMIGRNDAVYFAGDTAFSDHFEHIAHQYDSISTALMPIAPCEPRTWMKLSHMNAEEAVEAFLILKAKTFVPMHWGAFWFGVDEFSSPIERLRSYWHKQEALKNHELRILKVGEAHIQDEQLLSVPKIQQSGIISQSFVQPE